MHNNINATQTIHTTKVSEETKKEIFNDVEESYKKDIREMIFGKTCWRRTGISFETLSKVTVAIGGVLSFSSGYFDSKVLSFISGSVSVISLALLQFGSFSFMQSKKRASDLNILLKKLDIDTIPIIDDIPDCSNVSHNKTLEHKSVVNVNNEYDENKNFLAGAIKGPSMDSKKNILKHAIKKSLDQNINNNLNQTTENIESIESITSTESIENKQNIEVKNIEIELSKLQSLKPYVKNDEDINIPVLPILTNDNDNSNV
jgi:hypothetical protein